MTGVSAGTQSVSGLREMCVIVGMLVVVAVVHLPGVRPLSRVPEAVRRGSEGVRG